MKIKAMDLSNYFYSSILLLLFLLGGNLAYAQSTALMTNSNREISQDSLNSLVERGEVLLSEELIEWVRVNAPKAEETWRIYMNSTSDEVYFQPNIFSMAFRFDSAEQLKQAILNIRVKSSSRKPVFHDFITDTAPLFRHDEKNAEIVFDKLQISPRDLDMTIESVQSIQVALEKLPKDYDFFENGKPLTYAIANYIGDIIYFPQGGWAYEVDESGERILPAHITLASGQSYDWFRDFSRYFVERQFQNLQYIVSSVVR